MAHKILVVDDEPDVVKYLETLPPENNHCAELAVGAMYLALRNFQEFKRDPWKKLYHGK